MVRLTKEWEGRDVIWRYLTFVIIAGNKRNL